MLFLLLGGVLAAWFLQYFFYQKCWDRNLTVEVRFADSYVYEGDESCLVETIWNRKRMPLPALEVRLAMSRNLAFSGEAQENSNITDQSYRRDMFSFFGHQRVVRRLPFACRRRGYYEIRKSELVGYDYFYAHSYYREQRQSAWMYVYPRQVDASRLRLLTQAISGMAVTQNRLYPDPFEFSGIREYRPSDPMSHINWKASARSGSLMVNQFDSTTSVKVTVLLDVEDSQILRYEELTEEAIRIASSLAARLVKRGMELDFLSNAQLETHSSAEGEQKRDSGDVGTEGEAQPPDKIAADISLRESAGKSAMHIKTPAQVQELNRALSRLSLTDAAPPITVCIEAEASRKRGGRVFVLVSKNRRPQVLPALKALAALGNQILWVCPVHSYMEGEERGGQWLRFLRWEI